MKTVTVAGLRAGFLTDMEVGEELVLHPSTKQQTIVVSVMKKSGRKAKLRVQSHDAVVVGMVNGKTPVSAG